MSTKIALNKEANAHPEEPHQLKARTEILLEENKE